MKQEIKITDEETLALWKKTRQLKRKTETLLVEAQMLAAQSEYQRTLFWNAVGEKHGIDMSSVTWKYNEETQTVVVHKEEEENPLAKLLESLKQKQSNPFSLPKDKSGTVI